MAYGFNDDKSKHDISADLTQLENDLTIYADEQINDVEDEIANANNRLANASILTQKKSASTTVTIAAFGVVTSTLNISYPTGDDWEFVGITGINGGHVNAGIGTFITYLSDNTISVKVNVVNQKDSTQITATISVEAMFIKIVI